VYVIWGQNQNNRSMYQAVGTEKRGVGGKKGLIYFNCGDLMGNHV
jgi:hypothetical protein